MPAVSDAAVIEHVPAQNLQWGSCWGLGSARDTRTARVVEAPAWMTRWSQPPM